MAVALTILSINESINLYFIHSNCIDKASRLLVKVERIGYEGKHRYGLILLFYRAISPKLFLFTILITITLFYNNITTLYTQEISTFQGKQLFLNSDFCFFLSHFQTKRSLKIILFQICRGWWWHDNHHHVHKLSTRARQVAERFWLARRF